MPKAKKLFLLRETRETWRVRIDGKLRNAMCTECKTEVTWLSCADASLELGLSEREIFRLVDQGKFHFAESDEGRLLICGPSIRSTKSSG